MIRFLQASMMWSLAFPSLFIGYTFVAARDWLSFVFDAPYEAWRMVNQAIEEADQEEDEEIT